MQPDQPIVRTDEVSEDPSEKRERLLQEILGMCDEMAVQIVKISKKVVEYEQAGGDMTKLRRISHIHIMRKIGEGSIDPELYMRFRIKGDGFLKLVGGLPLTDQKMLASGSPIPQAVFTQDGKTDVRMRDPILMDKEEWKVVFAADHMRDPEEQIHILDRQLTKKRQTAPLERIGPFELDPVRKVAVIRGKHGDVVTLADLKAAVKALRK